MAQARSRKLLVERFEANSQVGGQANGRADGQTKAQADGQVGGQANVPANSQATGLPSRETDHLATEEPLEIRLNDTAIATTMRTPGHDFELAAGFCLAEGVLVGGAVASIRYCATSPASETEFNVVTVETSGDIPEPKPRLGSVTSACGVCGSQSIENLCAYLSPLPPGTARFELDVLAGIASQVRPHQSLFAKTGGVHAAAACNLAGEPLLVREDIGRHNAVDKVIGRLLLDDQLPSRNPQADPVGLFVSGRASFEMLQKAWAGGFVAVVAVSAPSALAVELAQQANIQLAGFARDASLNLYHP